MFKDYKAYQAGIDRIVFLQVLDRDSRLDESTAYELDLLLVAAQQYEDAMDAEAQAEYEFMQRFEENFSSSMDR